MSTERARILQMVSDRKITAEEAESLLDALGQPGPAAGDQETAGGDGRRAPRHLFVNVEPRQEGQGDRVNIRVPLVLVKAGMKLASVIPGEAQERINEAMREKGLDFDITNLQSGQLDELLVTLRELSIDVENPSERVRIYCE